MHGYLGHKLFNKELDFGSFFITQIVGLFNSMAIFGLLFDQ
jgi:hypothetical protein